MDCMCAAACWLLAQAQDTTIIDVKYGVNLINTYYDKNMKHMKNVHILHERVSNEDFLFIMYI